MAKHTRKPLFAEEGTPHIYAEWAGKRVILATVQVPEWHEDRISGGREAYANAVLFAAAPAMLALLLDLEWSGEDMHDGYVYPTCPVCEGGMPDWPRTPATYAGHFADCRLDQLITWAGGRSS